MKKHIAKVPNNKKAIAPYNFVELPDKVVTAELEPNGKLRDNNCYYSDRHTGRINCTLTTSSPLYIRCGLTKEQFECGSEAKDLPDFYYIDPITKKPVLPGSSLRGMLRTLVEIISFSKISQVSDYQRLFFRAVAVNPSKDSLGEVYKKYVEPRKVQAGYLKSDEQGWYIQPAIKSNGNSFAWVRETDLNLPEFKKFDDDNYCSQYIDVSYRDAAIDNNDKAKRLFAIDVDLFNIHAKKGVIVTSGNMKQDNQRQPSPRRNHCLVFECLVFKANPECAKLRIDDIAIEHYRNALTDFQKQTPFDKDWGIFKEDQPVFYYLPKDRNTVGFFGQSPNFRIPYSPNGDGKAATIRDFIPENLRDESIIDIADAIFGFVRQRHEKQPEGKEQSRAGRISVSDGICETICHTPPDNIFMTQGFITPKILASPKPTTYQHYLVQPEETNADKSKLKHYASKPIEQTVIRGHKLYWHKGSNPDFEHPKQNDAKDTQTTQIKPIKSGVTFKFNIKFENLSNVELGTLMWILEIAQNNNYRLSLGMGKPLGMGAVKIESKLYLSKRKTRYTKLFSNNDWETAESLDDDPDYQRDFENYILQQLRQTGKFNDVPRIQMLLAMLSWEGIAVSKTRYMEIEQQNPLDGEPNEYKNRRVLPTPLDVN